MASNKQKEAARKMELLAMLPDSADTVGIVELYSQQEIHIQIGKQRAGGNGKNICFLLRIYAGDNHTGQLSGRGSALE